MSECTVGILDRIGEDISPAANHMYIVIRTISVQYERAERAGNRHTDRARTDTARPVTRRNTYNCPAAVSARNVCVPWPRRGANASENVPGGRHSLAGNRIRVRARHGRIVYNADDKADGQIAVAILVGHHDCEACVRNAQRIVEQCVTVRDRAFSRRSVEDIRRRQ
ncbi:MAG: hypothetical protein WB475_20260 [Pseudolabrys sp.]